MMKCKTLIWVKIIHTLIWLFFNLVLFYMAYTVIVNRINKFVWIGIGCIVMEWIVLIFFRWQCPFTIIARKYTNSTKKNFDIYIPDWLAKYNKEIYITFFVITISGLIFRI